MHGSVHSTPISPGTEHVLLRVLACGSVDDGKSTLMGRLLYDLNAVFDDQLAALRRDSLRFGITADEIDFSLLLDGLEAEREQRITIDVAYRFFSTGRRSFILADAPGHEQYTCNMATGASDCNVAIILVDASKGLLPQTKRHSYICALMGIRHVVLAVNKVDLIGYSQEGFDTICKVYCAFAADLGFSSIETIPVSAVAGDNVSAPSKNMRWYAGPTLIKYLETIDYTGEEVSRHLRMEVELVCRPHADFRGYAGTVASGSLRPGDAVLALPSGRETRVQSIVTADGDLAEANAGDAVTITLEDEIDVSRGDIVVHPGALPAVADQIAAHLLWFAEEPLLPGRNYLMRIGTRWLTSSVTAIKHRIDINTLSHLSARQLERNEIGFCNLATHRPIAFDAYKDNRRTGAFILVDQFTNKTCAAGMIAFPLRRASNLRAEQLAIDKNARAILKHQRPAALWFTGLSGSGKSTIARLVEQRLHEGGYHTYVLDGDNVRQGLNRDLGFTDADRVENIRRVGEVARLFVDGGLIVLCSLISPFAAERLMVREMMGEKEFFEIFVDAPLEECIRRDPKGLYAQARAGLIKNFTGLDSSYERPETPDLVLDTTIAGAEILADKTITLLRDQGILTRPDRSL